jgi:hypothetical protein
MTFAISFLLMTSIILPPGASGINPGRIEFIDLKKRFFKDLNNHDSL